ncbi:MAG: hypoxanthine phosphoribosyltransferase [Erysipelotrichaceae bacterium]
MNNDIKEILITEDEIINRCKELGKEITEDYQGKTPILIGLLKGSVPFLAELMKRIEINMEIDFMDVSSYSGTESTGDVRIDKDLSNSIVGDDVIVVEDIVDTGKTLQKVVGLLYSKGANSVRIVSLLDKPERRIVDLKADYIGFTIPDAFVVGFGLDFNQKYRNLPYVGILKEDCYKE